MSVVPPSPALSDLGSFQLWFQSVTMHPGGVEAGVEGGPALARLVRASSRLTPAERMRVYSNAYTARLVECLESQYPALRRALGEGGFTAFARAYLEQHPSRHWSLDRLGAELASFLARTRPEREGNGPDWADLLVELAEFEWTVLGVFDGEGIERRAVLGAEELAAIDPDAFGRCRFVPAPSLQLRRFRFPLHEYYARLREIDEDQPLSIPAPDEQRLAIHRQRYRVVRYVLGDCEYRLLEALIGGACVGEGIERALSETAESDEQLALSLKGWFERWTREGFFLSIV